MPLERRTTFSGGCYKKRWFRFIEQLSDRMNLLTANSLEAHFPIELLSLL